MNSYPDQAKKKVLNFFEHTLAYSITAGLIALFFYPMWSEDRMYMVEWTIAVATAFAAFLCAKQSNPATLSWQSE